MKRYLCFAIVIFCLLCCVEAVVGQGISVAPSRIFFTGAPGETVTQRLTLSNTGKASVILKSSFKEWLRDSLGDKTYYDSGMLAYSNYGWVQVMPEVVEIEPGGKKEVTVIMHVPQTKLPTEHVTNSMLFFTQINEQKAFTKKIDGKNVGVVIKLEVGIHLYHTPPGFNEKNADFVAFQDRGLVQGITDTVRRLALQVKNTGNIVMNGEVRFELTNKMTGEEQKLNATNISMLPGAEQIVYLDLPAHMPGSNYLAVALLDSGTETNLKVAEKEISYKP